jgi:glycerol-3-phosphate dehydrogenase
MKLHYLCHNLKIHSMRDWTTMQSEKIFDLLVVGGGINGTGIALDAAGRGLSVILCEQQDLGSGTSSASTKLIHGGLRYLENYDFGLVRESLNEREVLMNKAPHLITPLRFIIPYDANQRPKWMIQLGLWLYDHLGKHCTLERSKRLKIDKACPFGKPLSTDTQTAFAYSDCWVDDARLVITNAIGAAQLGARIYTNTKVTSLHVDNQLWHATVYDMINHVSHPIMARSVINATGPWIKEFNETHPLLKSTHQIRLVRGSHIIVPKRYDGNHAYLIQHTDGRIIFVIPYEEKFTLIGTTEVLTDKSPDKVQISEEEKKYLITIFNSHFNHSISESDIVWEYSGVRPLVDHSGTSNTELSRDYLLDINLIEGAPILSVYGGKITTYRTLAEAALDKLSPYFPDMRDHWTAQVALPGGDIFPESFDEFVEALKIQYPWVPNNLLTRLARQHGTRIHLLLTDLHSIEQLGQHFGEECYEHELHYLMEHEWAKTADDLLFRRTKLGLHLNPDTIQNIKDWLRKTMPLY